MMQPIFVPRRKLQPLPIFLSVLTLAFMVTVTVIYWQQNQPRDDVVPRTIVSLQHRFSQEAGRDEVTNGYGSGAKIIHDLEAYPEAKNLFKKKSNLLLEDKKPLNSLVQVRRDKEEATEFGLSHVYNTSYYIGNLLVYPEVSLHELLMGSYRPLTTELLETVLADVRSGVTKLQDYYDVAPPILYDETLGRSLYFVTPSYPSLTMSEVAIATYLLAELDPINSRLYELSLHQYANQLLASGAHFRVDIEVALELADVYFKIIKANSEYQSLLAQTKTEWVGSTKVNIDFEILPKFKLDGFPTVSKFKVSVANKSKVGVSDQQEGLAGNLLLSLIDERLPQPKTKLYEYNFINQQILPIGLDLLPKRFPGLGDSVAGATYLSTEKYVFLSGNQPVYEGRGPISKENTDIFYRNTNDVKRLTKTTPVDSKQIVTRSNLSISQNEKELLYEEQVFDLRSDIESPQIKLLSLDSGLGQVGKVVGLGYSPYFAFRDKYVLFIRGNKVLYHDSSSGLEQEIYLPDLLERKLTSFNLTYSNDSELLAIYTSGFDKSTLQSNSQILFYKLVPQAGKLLAIPEQYMSIEDTALLDVQISPQGNYAAIALTEGIGKNKLRVLIFDIKSGIIKKDINLTPFAVQSVEIDGWALF